MNNIIQIELDYPEDEIIVNINSCFLTNAQITTLVTLLWEYSWNVEGEFEATNCKNEHWFIFGFPFASELELFAKELKEKVQKLFPNTFIIIK